MKLNVKQLTIIIFIVLCIISGYHYGYENVIWQTIAAVITAIVTNLAIDYFNGMRSQNSAVAVAANPQPLNPPTGIKKLIISESAIITGLIIAMVAAPNSPLWEIIFLSFLAIVSKFIIKINKRTLFNPTALSLLIGIIIFRLPMGWWGDYNHLLTIAAGSLLLIKYHGHWKMIYAFIITFIVLIIIQSLFLNLSIIEEIYFKIGISFFFTFFMLTDPRTTPLMEDQYITFGIITAIGSFGTMLLFPSSIFIAGLLLANLATPYLNKLSLQKIKARIPVKMKN